MQIPRDCFQKVMKAEQKTEMENNISKMGSGLWSYDQHIDHGGFSPQKHLLMEEANHQEVVY